MHIALFILYSALCGYGILKLPFFRRTGIRPGILLAFFAIHVGAGCLHNLIAWRYYPDHGDIWDSFREGIQLRNWLQTDFQQFLASNSRWTDFTHNGVKFIHLILNLLSMDNLYINTLLFAFPVFLGNTALYFVFRRHFQAPLTPLVVFLLPSTLFWTACVFREGVLYMLLGFFFYQLDRVFSSPAPAAVSHNRQAAAARTPAAIAAFCCFLLILYFRFTVGIVLAPALLVMRWVNKPSTKEILAAAGAALTVLVIMLAVPPFPRWLLQGLRQWQAEFQILEGHSRLYLPAMDGTWPGLFRIMPYALLNGWFQPLPGAGGRPIYLAFSIELILIWAVVALALVRAATSPATPALPAARRRDGFSAACILFALLGMFGIGLIVPFAGAIVRYRSIYLPFLLLPALHSLRDWRRFRA
ncbi:MAG TPA: hypothetical protein VKU83_01060 [Puia sp.]|nr:hypothetical protein [Puia sp.]